MSTVPGRKPAPGPRDGVETTEKPPDSLPAWRRLAEIAFTEREWDAAVKALVLLGSTHLARREPARATEVYRRLAALAPKDPRAVHLVGVGLLAQGKRAEGRKELEAALAPAPGFVDPLTQLVALSFAEKQPDTALERVNRHAALALSPRFAPAANNLAWILSEHGGDRDRALALAQTAKEQAPGDPYVSDTLGWIFYRRGVHQRALALLEDSAARRGFGNPQVQYHLGMVSAQLGDEEAARQAWGIA